MNNHNCLLYGHVWQTVQEYFFSPEGDSTSGDVMYSCTILACVYCGKRWDE